MTKSEHPQPLQPIYLWKWYIFKNDNVWTAATFATYLSSKMIYIFYLWKWCIPLKMTKSEHPQPSQPLQPIYLWKWYIFKNDKVWTSATFATYLSSKMIYIFYLWKWCIPLKMTKSERRNPRNPCNLFIFENDIYFEKWQSLNIRNPRNPRNPCNLFIFENDISFEKWPSLHSRNPRNLCNLFQNDKVWTSGTLATLATYLSLKMIYILKNDKVVTSTTLATIVTCLSLKMTKSEHPQPLQPLQPLQPIYLWKRYIFKNDKVWTSATLATLATYLSLKMIYL